MFGGWHVGGIYTLASGFPFSPLPRLQTHPTLEPNQQFDPINYEMAICRRISALPTVGSTSMRTRRRAGFAFGNAGRNSLIGPGQNVFDGSLRKTFSLTESQKLEFRAEFFNMFNHPNFAQPDNFFEDGPDVGGAISSVAIPMRQIQFGLKYSF